MASGIADLLRAEDDAVGLTLDGTEVSTIRLTAADLVLLGLADGRRFVLTVTEDVPR